MRTMMHRTGLFFLFMVVLSSGLLFAQSDSDVSIPPQIQSMNVTSLFEQGSQLIEQEKYAEAKPYYLAIIQKDSTQAGAYKRLSDIAYHQFDMNQAQEYLRKAIEKEPTNEDYRQRFDNIAELINNFKAGVDASNRRNYSEAIQKFDAVLDEFPGFAPAHYRLGFVYSTQEKVDQAVQSFKRAIQEDPNNNNYQKALENMAKSHFQNGINAYRRGDLTGAEQGFKTAISIDSNFKQAQYMLGIIARRRGNTNEAIRRYQAAIDIDLQYEQAWFAMGLAYKSSAQDNKALNAFTHATDINSNYDKAWVERGLLLTKMKRYDQAINSFRQAIQANSQNATAHEGMGMVYKEQGNFQQAAQQFETALGFDETDYVLHYRLADTYHELGDYQKQKTQAQQALEYKANYSPALVSLGDAECHLGNQDAAKATYQKAMRDADWRPVAQHKIEIMDKTGECE